MPSMPPTLPGAGARFRRQARAEADARRGSAQARGYDSRWDKAAASFRAAHPLCEYCLLDGRTSASELVDHLYPHRRFAGVFWVRDWWVAACHLCHRGMKARVEGLGKAAIDALAVRLGRRTLEDRGG